MYKLQISKRAENEVNKLPFRYRDAIINAFEEFVEDPLLGKPLT